MRFTDSHEWILISNDEATAVVGITNHAQHELGDIVYVELPQIGSKLEAGKEAAVLESTKAAADVYSPASGTVLEVNEKLRKSSELINQSPEKEGWIFKLRLDNGAAAELELLMDNKRYEQFLTD
jgi:glycine cleavage system H protein